MPNSRHKREVLTLVVVFVSVVLVSAFVVYFISGARRVTPDAVRQAPQPDAVLGAPDQRDAPIAQSPGSETFIDRLFGSQHSGAYLTGATWAETMGRISLRLALAALLGAALAFRPRKRILALKRNPYVSQTQILLAVVAAALMIIVGDNAARAFGIFAAVSLVRFRTNIRDPKEITVLLISLALGLASGFGRWDLALVLAIFSLIVLWLLEWREPQLVFRSMELKVITTNVVSTQRALRDVLKTHGFDKELRAVDREVTEESPGSIVYSVDVSPTVSTDEISADILAIDGQNVQGIAWDQKKSHSYPYQ
ncbi:MAG TPA: DUF4956 domain-containing protein [Pyrinomonadaceae bacterium]|jgi:uncharacterized membrane protein YhiD involved in acid resistance|nr:DUF4956 domain-containing protein [Pyrinomonadaceae bacterium]